MRERLAYSLWRELGVTGPRSTHMDVRLHLSDCASRRCEGGEQDGGNRIGRTDWPLGMHLLTEVVDGRFTDTWYKGGDGNVYKEAWPGMQTGALQYLLETNTDPPDVSRMEEFGAALQGASNDWELVQVVRRFMKARTVSKYWAVDRAVDMWDGPIFFRQQGRGYWNHVRLATFSNCLRCSFANRKASRSQNYFLAQSDDEVDSEFWLVPWDVDDTFAPQGRTSYGAVREFPAWDEPVEACVNYDHFGSSMAPSCFKLIRAFARGLRSEFMEAATQLLDGPFALCRLQAKVDRWHDAIAPFMAADAAAGLYPARDSEAGTLGST